MNTLPTPDAISEDRGHSAEERVTPLRGVTSLVGSPASEREDEARDQYSVTSSDGPVDVAVRSIKLRDVPGLVRIPNVLLLNQPEAGLGSFSATAEALRAIGPGGRSRPRLFTAAVDERVVGFAEFRATLPDRRWHAIALGSATGVYDAGPVVDAMLRHAITAAGLRGVKRLYARAPNDSDTVECFCRAGFAPFASETVFAAEEIEQRGQPIPVRRQEQTDTWAIHQLYNATVPRQVQYAEALTSHRWDLTGADELAPGSIRSGWLVDEGHAVAAYGRITHGRQSHAVEVLFLADRFDIVSGLIDALLNQIKPRLKGGTVYFVLRGYQTEAVKILEMRGFEPVREQVLLVKYTTAAARPAAVEPVALHADVIERLPKRVPSFLKQEPRNDPAN
jgi:hypothetical protein